MQVNDLSGDRKAQAGSLACVFGGEERVEDFLHVLLRDSRSAVLNLDDDCPVSRPQPDAAPIAPCVRDFLRHDDVLGRPDG